MACLVQKHQIHILFGLAWSDELTIYHTQGKHAILELFWHCGILLFFILLSIYIVITFTLQASTFQIAILLQFNPGLVQALQ
jgi:hypothetical protein